MTKTRRNFFRPGGSHPSPICGSPNSRSERRWPRARYRWHSRSTVREIFDRLGADQTARRTIDEVARIIAIAILAVQSVIDPDVVAMGGSIGVRPELTTQVAAQLARCMHAPVPVEISALGSRATLIGAIGSAIDMVHRKVLGIGAEAASLAP